MVRSMSAALSLIVATAPLIGLPSPSQARNVVLRHPVEHHGHSWRHHNGRHGWHGHHWARRGWQSRHHWRGRRHWRENYWRGYGRPYGYPHHHHDWAGPSLGGFVAGAIVGGAIGSLSHRSVAYCQAHFRSYNVRTHSYLGYDGHRHTCP
jgi:hypothetical protein